MQEAKRRFTVQHSQTEDGVKLEAWCFRCNMNHAQSVPRILTAEERRFARLFDLRCRAEAPLLPVRGTKSAPAGDKIGGSGDLFGRSGDKIGRFSTGDKIGGVGRPKIWNPLRGTESAPPLGLYNSLFS